MEDSRKLNFIYNGDITIQKSNVRVIEIGSGDMEFRLDERFPWINVYIGDNSDEGFAYYDEIDDIESSFISDDEFMTIALNYYVQHVKFITRKEMNERVQKYYKKLEKENKKVKQILSQYTDEQLLNEVNERGLLGGN
ncbi:hypothetical protein [Intestinibacter bartlettii]|uniref:hypothetical protein n=1 Tax=Intestinibacter bartlettii TaxID=261299 RepID=UPI0039A28FB4